MPKGKKPMPSFMRDLFDKDENAFRRASRKGGKKAAEKRRASRKRAAEADLPAILDEVRREREKQELRDLYESRGDKFEGEDDDEND